MKAFGYRLVVGWKAESFPCGKFVYETGETGSFVTHHKVLQNQQRIRT